VRGTCILETIEAFSIAGEPAALNVICLNAKDDAAELLLKTSLGGVLLP
jgi:hypothetical protein